VIWIRAQFVNLLVVVVMAGVVLAGATATHNQGAELRRVAVETHGALCALKVDLERRAVASEQYVEDVEEGRRRLIKGITLTDLRRSIDNQRATLASLSELDCSRDS
jgi:hypothetical protein